MEMEQTDSYQSTEGRGAWWSEGEGTGQGTCMNDPWTWTTVLGWTVGWDGGGQRGKI